MILTIFLSAFWSHSFAHGHGINISNGGDALLCYASPQEAIAHEKLPDSAILLTMPYTVTLDYWLAISTSTPNGVITDRTIALLRSYEDEAPHFRELNRAYKVYSALEAATGLSSVFGNRPIPFDWEKNDRNKPLPNYEDELLPFPFGFECSLAQAAIRMGNQFSFNPTIIYLLRSNPLAPDQVAILMLHELLAKLMREQGGFFYEPERIGYFIRDWILFLERRNLLHTWAAEHFSWNQYFASHPGARQEVLELLVRNWILTPEALGLGPL